MKRISTKSIFAYFLKIYCSFIIISSILVGILFPMFIVVGVFFSFIFSFNNISWILADPTIPFKKEIWQSWLAGYLTIDKPTIYPILIFIEAVIFTFGLVIFMISLIQLIIGLKKKKGIVRIGFYKYIRHPQNLALIIMTFPLCLFLPFTGDLGIRIGDFVSWIQFSFLIIIYSDIGDVLLKKKYPAQFLEYYESTGFMVPKLFKTKVSNYFSILQHKKIRYMFFVILYIGIICILYYFYLVGPFFRYW